MPLGGTSALWTSGPDQETLLEALIAAAETFSKRFSQGWRNCGGTRIRTHPSLTF